jgi:adenylate cyclase
MADLTEGVEQKNTILNLYNSGIDPEIISLELDISKDIVLKVIKNESNKEASVHTNRWASDSQLNRLYLEAIIDVKTIIKDSQFRTWQALKVKPDFNISIKDTRDILEKYLESKLNLVILHIDLVGSTKMSLSLPIDRLTTIIRSFAQQMSLIVSMYGGYVLKYIGDAVLAFFVVEDNINFENDEDKRKLSRDKDNFNFLQFTNAINCACTMIKIIKEGINPILNQYDYPELKVRIGMDVGEIAVVQYGVDVEEYNETVLKKPHIDLIGYTISIAVKMTSLAKPNNIVIGQKLFDKIDAKQKNSFMQLTNNNDIWNYTSESTGGLYNIYATTMN